MATDYPAADRRGKVGKYHNRKVITEDGEKFDSRGEYLRWRELCNMQELGYIHDLQRQVKFELVPAQREPDTVGARGGIKKGKIIEMPINYIADFVYYTSNGEKVVEDYKGFRTQTYILKRKLMLYMHGVKLVEHNPNHPLRKAEQKAARRKKK